jgi:RNA polymerase sigma-70 factor (ECF subfamily)
MKAAPTAVPSQAGRDAAPHPAVEVTAREIAEAGARFVPQTLRYLGVAEALLMDAVQDVFLVALRRRADFEGRSSLRTWLYGICVRVAHDQRRRARASREALVEQLPELPVVAAQEGALEQAEWRRALVSLLAELDHNQRAVFVLYELEGLTMKEVADALACPLQTAYFRHKSAKTRVLEAFAQLENADG